MRTNVYFVGDSYRGDQATNIQRLFEIVGHVVNAHGAKAELRISHTNRLTGFENWLPGWVRSLRREEPSVLSDLDPAASAVVAFELSGVDRLQLDAAGIPWVNFEIHPVRFLEDLYLSVEASFPVDLSRVEIPDDYIFLRAEVLRAKYRPEAQAESENRLLIVGQAPNDKSIYFDGEFKQLPDYFAGLDPIVAGFDGTDYRPHPYLTDADVDASIRTRYGAGACDEPNIYKVFTSGRYRAVCGISSSVLCEAPFFGLQSRALEPRARRFGHPVSYAKLIRDCHLWLNGLLGVSVTPRAYDALPPVPENHLRQVYCSWAYVSQEEELKQALSSIEMRVRQAESGLSGLLQVYGKEGPTGAAASLPSDCSEAEPHAGKLAPEAFLYEPDWTGLEWVEVVLSYVEAFEPGEPVSLILPIDPERPDAPSLEAAEARLVEVVAQTGRVQFPDIVLTNKPGELLELLRSYSRFQWLPPERAKMKYLIGKNGVRYHRARARFTAPE